MTTTTVPSPDSIATACDALVDARRIAAEWQAKKIATAAGLREVEDGLGERLPSDPCGETTLAEQIVTLEARLRSATSARDADPARCGRRKLLPDCRGRRPGAQADEPDAGVQGEHSKHKAKVQRLLTQLEKLEDCRTSRPRCSPSARRTTVTAWRAQA